MKPALKNRPYLIKVFLLIFLPMAGLMAVLLAFFDQEVREDGQGRLKEKASQAQSLQILSTKNRLTHMVGDFYYLSQQQGLFKQLSQGQPVPPISTKKISQFIGASEWIDQFRFIDLQGQEKYRIDQVRRGTPILIPTEQLQNKSKRGYFVAARSLDPQKFHISGMTLNQEHGKVEVPFKPMLRMSMSVFDQDHRIGVVVVNFRVDRLLRELKKSLPIPGTEVMFVNRTGHYLLHNQPAYEWGGDIADRRQHNLGWEHTKAWETIRLQGRGSVETSRGVYVFQTIDLSDANLDFFQVQPFGEQLPKWKLVTFAPKELLLARHSEQMRGVILPYGVLLFALAVLSVLFAIKQQKLKDSLGLVRLSSSHLEKRIKELNCLYSISHLTESESVGWDDMMQQIVDQLPQAWNHPAHCSASLSIGTQKWETKGTFNPVINQDIDLKEGSRRLGQLSVRYDHDYGDEAFANEESSLLESVGLRIVKVIQIRRVKEELRIHQLSLETEVLQRTDQLREANCNLIVEIEQKEKLAQNLELERSKTEEAMKIKSNFLSLVVHDLKSPFFSLLGVLRRVVKHEENLNPKHRELLINSINSGQDLLKMVDKLVTINKIQSGKIVPEYQVINLSLLFDQIFNQFRDGAEQKGILLSHQISPNTELESDPFLLGEVINNLLSNAIKFCTSGDTVTLEESFESSYLLKVTDTGLGIEPERVPHLFKEQTMNSTLGTLGEKGSGLGLNYCADITELLEGGISVQSEVNQGSQFIIELPIRRIQGEGPKT